MAGAAQPSLSEGVLRTGAKIGVQAKRTKSKTLNFSRE